MGLHMEYIRHVEMLSNKEIQHNALVPISIEYCPFWYRFVVRSCFGGPDDCYILSGSEECKVLFLSSTSLLLPHEKYHCFPPNPAKFPSWPFRNDHWKCGGNEVICLGMGERGAILALTLHSTSKADGFL